MDICFLHFPSCDLHLPSNFVGTKCPLMTKAFQHLPSLTLTPLSPLLFVHTHHGWPGHDLNCNDMATLVEDVIWESEHNFWCCSCQIEWMANTKWSEWHCCSRFEGAIWRFCIWLWPRKRRSWWLIWLIYQDLQQHSIDNITDAKGGSIFDEETQLSDHDGEESKAGWYHGWQ